MASLETLCRTVRVRFGLPTVGAPVDPDWLLTMLDELEPEPVPFCERDGLYGNKVRWNECAPKSTQRHQIARACCAYLLRGMRQLQHSPGRFAEMLCGTSAVDTQVEDIRAELHALRDARVTVFTTYAALNAFASHHPAAAYSTRAAVALRDELAHWHRPTTLRLEPGGATVTIVRPRRRS